jgi:hypothetical protein
VEIRYFTSGITWAADYVGVANEDETKLNLTRYVRVTNNSGELYDNARTRLVVGTINLLEKIADLARRPPPGKTVLTVTGTGALTLNGGILSAKVADYDYRVSHGTLAGNGIIVEKGKDVQKQGLSEYFLFTIEGREDIKDKEPKRLVALKVAEVPLECLYKLTDRDGGQGFTKFYRFKNVKPLPAKVELERRFDADVLVWCPDGQPQGWNGNEPGAYVDLHTVPGRVERVDQNHVEYFLDLKPGEKEQVQYSVTYKRRKVGPELNAEKKREPL